MENLAQIPLIKDKLKVAPRMAICAMHKLVFEQDGDRSNRKRLREFKGFPFKNTSQEYADKLTYAGTLTLGDLISVCNILGVNYDGNKEQIRERILKNLMDLNQLARLHEQENVITEDEDEENVENGNEVNSVDDDAGDGDDEEDNNRTDYDEQEVQGAEAGVNNTRKTRNERIDSEVKCKVTFNFKDVPDFVREFDGADAFSVERWIADFEDAALMFQWSELEKVVFAKKTLKGVAKLFMYSEGTVKTWKKFKELM